MSPKGNIELAYRLFKERNYLEAFYCFRQYLQDNPPERGAVRHVLECCFHLKYFADAETYFSLLKSHYPDWSLIPFYEARIEDQRLNFNSAYQLYEIALDKNSQDEYISNACIRYMAGKLIRDAQQFEQDLKFDEANKIYKSALQLFPNYQPLLNAHDRYLKALKEIINISGNKKTTFHYWGLKEPLESYGSPNERVLVACWDLCHNCIGRGVTMAEAISDRKDVLIAGPMFAQYGQKLWSPLQNSVLSVPICGWHSENVCDLFNGALLLAKIWPADCVWVSKSRFPSVFIGLIYRAIHGSKIICDIDDNELAFVNAPALENFDQFLHSFSYEDWNKPFSASWTQLAQLLIKEFDLVTACNDLLVNKFNAILIPHCRSAAAALNASCLRETTRSSLGFNNSDHIILFNGTIRRHKGVLEIAKALASLKQPNIIFAVAGIFEDVALQKELLSIDSVRIKLIDSHPYSENLNITAIADDIILLQDPTSPAALFQTPAKLTDALSQGCRVYVSDIGPFSSFIEAGAAIKIPLDTPLSEYLIDQFSVKKRNQDAFEFFNNHLSYGSIQSRLDDVLNIELSRRKSCSFSALTKRLFTFLEKYMPGHLEDTNTNLIPSTIYNYSRISPIITVNKPFNIIFFWKQNDTGLFGRRQDMLLNEIASHADISNVLHIDSPVCSASLQFESSSIYHPGISLSVANYRASSAIARANGFLDKDNIFYRTFIYSEFDKKSSQFSFPDLSSYPNTVASWIEELGMNENLVAWVCPSVFGFESVYNRLKFPFVVSDFIDDQSLFTSNLKQKFLIKRDYKFMASISDVSICNCAPMIDQISELGVAPILVPNGIDDRPIKNVSIIPKDITDSGVVIGYCGNMNYRFDFSLIEFLARSRPQWNIVLIGSLSKTTAIELINKLPNVTWYGALQYEISRQYISKFDVGIVPHLDSDLSGFMNPLKIFVYRALNISVVSTNVKNISDIKNGVYVETTYDDFLSRIDRILDSVDIYHLDKSIVESSSWKARFAQIWGEIVAKIENK